MRAVIIGGGYIGDHAYIKSKIKPDDYIICADAGYDHAVKMGIEPNILIGDFDSIADLPRVLAGEENGALIFIDQDLDAKETLAKIKEIYPYETAEKLSIFSPYDVVYHIK